MSPKIGIARALYSYYHFPLWKKFLEELGCEIVLSEPTTRKTIEQGVKIAPEEICLPVKTYFGHISQLIQTPIDYLLIPRMFRIKAHNEMKFGCPKAIGLPDMIKALFKNPPHIIDLTIDEQVANQRQSFYNVGKIFTNSNKKIHEAYNSAQIEQEKYINFLYQGLKPSEIFSHNPQEKDNINHITKSKIGLIGHPYLVYDDDLSLSLLSELQKLGVDVIKSSSVVQEIIIQETEKLSQVHWFYEQPILGSTAHFLKRKDISGLIFVFSFACGTTAVVSEIIRRELLDFHNIPTLTLLLDEHTAHSGLITRLESFIDLVEQKYRKSTN